MQEHGSDRVAPSFTTDVGVAVAFVLCAWLITHSSAAAAVELRALHLALLFGAALLAGGIAILGAMGARTLRHAGPAWLGAAFALDGAVVIPLAALAPNTRQESPGLQAVATAADIAMVALLVVARRPPLHLGTAGPWAVAVGCAILATLVGAAADRWPALAGLLLSTPLTAAVGLAWAVVAITSVVTGVLEREQPRWRVGLGLCVIASTHVFGGAAGAGAVGAADLFPTALQLIGLLGVLSGPAIRLHVEMTSLLSEHEQQQLELSETALHARRAAELAAERDHELANGLAGLSGIAHLLGQPPGGQEGPQLRSAVLAELSRLHELLAHPPATAAGGTYDAAAVVTELAALRRLAGLDIEVTAQGSLEVAGLRNAFAQVITNLLANCARHAPGAAVRIRAERCESRAVIDVCDDGPGIPDALREQVMRPGVALGVHAGHGLGLDVSARLLARQGGTLRILPRPPGQRGCAVRVELPLAG